MGSWQWKVDEKAFQARLEGYMKGAIEAAEKAVLEGMQLAFRQSQREVPVRTGVLKNSGQLVGPERLGEHEVQVAITYGGAATAYAQYQHDNRTLHHPGGGKAGYVIDPVKAAIPDIVARLGRALKDLGHHGG